MPRFSHGYYVQLRPMMLPHSKRVQSRVGRLTIKGIFFFFIQANQCSQEPPRIQQIRRLIKSLNWDGRIRRTKRYGGFLLARIDVSNKFQFEVEGNNTGQGPIPILVRLRA